MKLSITMMVKDEEKNLERCLNSLQPLMEAFEAELIIVDTGSNDGTIEIARKFTDKVYFHPWNNDFSAMRNITIGYATGEWIFIIDADEEVIECREMINFLKDKKSRRFGALAINCRNIGKASDAAVFSNNVGYRIFRNDGFFHYEGAVHNQPIFKGAHIALTEVWLVHYGYISDDPELMEKKFKRTSAILQSELEKDPTNEYYWSQMAVTYGMHNEHDKAVECIEKAYALINGARDRKYMHIYTHMIIMYEMVKNFARVEEVCLEALTISKEYLDVYYFLAEAQAVLKKPEAAIENYQNYLRLLDDYGKSSERDLGNIEYTLGYKNVVYFNLSNLYKKQGEYQIALQYAELVSDMEGIKKNLPPLLFLYLKLERYAQMRAYFDKHVEADWQEQFFKSLDDVLNELSGEFAVNCELELARCFKDVRYAPYALRCKLIVESAAGEISVETKQKLAMLKLNELPIYCSDIYYYLLEKKYPLVELFTKFKESWLVYAFTHITKRHADLGQVICDYLEKSERGVDVTQFKLFKTLERMALLMNSENAQYANLFERYLEDGLQYMESVYSKTVLDNLLIYDVKNDEEVFLLYMNQAKKLQKIDPVQSVNYLRLALQAFPAMKQGVETWLQRLQPEYSPNEKEFQRYKLQIKEEIKRLIEDGKMAEAKTLLGEYKEIVPADIEAIFLETKLLLN